MVTTWISFGDHVVDSDPAVRKRAKERSEILLASLPVGHTRGTAVIDERIFGYL